MRRYPVCKNGFVKLFRRDIRQERLQLLKKLQTLICVDDLVKGIDAWKRSRLIVLGDTIVDQYAACEALGMSAEAPVVVVRELEKKNFLGGAAIVAGHIRARCSM